MVNSKVSIVIVTRNRWFDLLQCIGSLAAQTVLPEELVIIDNNSSDATSFHLSNFKNSLSFPVRYVVEKKRGYPAIYNRGLREAKHKWLAFIDDDCVANPFWIQNIKKRISLEKGIDVIVGLTTPYNFNNFFSLMTYIFHLDWITKNIHHNKVINFEILDNKNIVYNNYFLKKHGIYYDEHRTQFLGGAAEDSDLGLQIQASGGNAFFDRSILVSHKEATSFFPYWRKMFLRYAAYITLLDKWSGRKKFRKKEYHFRDLVGTILDEYNYNGLVRMLAFFHIYFVVIVNMGFNFFLKPYRFKRYFVQLVQEILY